MTTRGGRVVRGSVAALFSVFVAALAHAAGGGSAPGLVGVSVALAFAILASIALAGRSLSTVRLSISVLFSQGAFHVVFLMTGKGSSAILPTPQAPGMHMPVAAHMAVGPTGMTEASTMWLAHAVAAGLTIVALRWGETALRSVVTALRLAFGRGARAIRIAPHRPAPPSGFAVERDGRRARFLSAGLRHRGPPASLFVPA